MIMKLRRFGKLIFGFYLITLMILVFQQQFMLQLDTVIKAHVGFYTNDIDPTARVTSASTTTPCPIPTHPPSNGPIKVLLVTYFRGGSTFLGEALNQNQEAFYWFEPLRGHLLDFLETHKANYSNEREDALLHYHNGTIIHYPEEYVDKQMDNVVNILNCRFDKLDKLVLQEFFNMERKKSPKLSKFNKCVDKNVTKKNKRIIVKNEVLDRCLNHAINACNSSRIRAIKTIRVGLHMIPTLLERDPEIRVVHYVRDPRGSLVSALKLWKEKFSMNRSHSWARDKCFRMHDDYSWFKKLNPVCSPENVLALQYEDLVINFNSTLHELYSFIGTKLPKSVHSWFQNNLHANKDNGAMGTSRQNALGTAFKWKNVLPKESNDVFYNVCKNVLDEYGYLNRFKNLSIPSTEIKKNVPPKQAPKPVKVQNKPSQGNKARNVHPAKGKPNKPNVVNNNTKIKQLANGGNMGKQGNLVQNENPKVNNSMGKQI